MVRGSRATRSPGTDARAAIGPALRESLRTGGRLLAAGAACALVALPVAVEQTLEHTSVDDQLGTVPVRLQLSHNGTSTLATGILGDLYWDRTGPFGLGVRAQVQQPPQAGGTLASYVDPAFIRANLAFLDDVDAAVAAYAGEFGDRVVGRVLLVELVVATVGALGLLVWRRVADPLRSSGRGSLRLAGGMTAVALVAATGGSALRFALWDQPPAQAHDFAAVPGLSFSSPQTLELARQVRPFIEKNVERTEARTATYRARAQASFAGSLERRADELAPRAGELLVLAEADPQGSFVGAEVRTGIEAAIVDRFGDDVALRTISGDITSNGTVAEDAFVAEEAAVGGELPTVAVAGDHDSAATRSQMTEHGMTVPDLRTHEIGGLRVAGANDVEHKALFGTLVSNESGLSEHELGARLRSAVEPGRAVLVLIHQPEAAAGYLGLDDLASLPSAPRSLTTPVEDEIADVPPGTLAIGHLHDLDGPWVLWNTDGDTTTWTVVDQLGTAGGVEESPTFNRFSTPLSLPLKPLTLRLQYLDAGTGLQTGFATVLCGTSGRCALTGRTDVGLPLVGQDQGQEDPARAALRTRSR